MIGDAQAVCNQIPLPVAWWAPMALPPGPMRLRVPGHMYGIVNARRRVSGALGLLAPVKAMPG